MLWLTFWVILKRTLLQKLKATHDSLRPLESFGGGGGQMISALPSTPTFCVRILSFFCKNPIYLEITGHR